MAMTFDSSSLVQKFGCGRRKPDDPFFQAGDTACSMRFREGIVEYGFEEYEFVREKKDFPCTIPTCRKVSHSPADFEAHFNSCHRFICSECKKSLPSPHLLDLHLHETHSAFFSVQADKKPMYKCFVEACDAVSMTPKERHDHCIEVHKFPHNYRFDRGTGKPGKYTKFTKNTNASTSQKKPDAENTKESVPNEKEESEQKPDKDSVKTSTSSNEKKPSQVFSFGHAAAHNHKFIPRTLAVTRAPNKQNRGKHPNKKKVEVKNEVKSEEMMEVKPDESMEVKDEVKPEVVEEKNEAKSDAMMVEKNEVNNDEEMMEVS
ncbi:zinc finger protein 511 isoform X2 [Nilaparvata lugens]|nr:zinc finger protein 511 isoform X2 [Nilaparvata lugens]